jgi:acetylornithine deacetylase/succinyl-diaminopimelate desuccinylase-like protein
MSKSARVLLVLGLVLSSGSCRKEQHALFERDQTRSASDWLKDESVHLLRDYVRIQTTDDRGEREGAEFLKNLLDCEGIESEIVCPAPRRCNLLARLPGRSREGALLLLNHIDVVNAYPQFWKDAKPFDGTIKNGYLYGRGAYDMKSIALSELFAFRNLKRRGIVPRSDILFLAEADEEREQKWGSMWLLEHRPEWFQGIANVLNEGGVNETVLRDVRYWGIETLQAGLAYAEFEAESRETLSRFQSNFPQRSGPAIAPLPQIVFAFGLLANHLSSPLTEPLRHLDRVWRNPAELAILPDRYGAFLQPRMSWTPIFDYPPSGGGKPHTIYVVSTPPQVRSASYLAPVLEAASREKLRLVESFATEPTTASPFPTAFTDLLQRVNQAHHPGVPFGPLPGGWGTTTSLLYRQRGIPAYGYSPIPMNILDAGRRHGNDERVYLRDYVDGNRLYTDILEEFAFQP